MELLIVVSLLALIGGVTVAALSGGLKVWRRAMSIGVTRQAALITADALRHDLLSLRTFAPLGFEGGPEEFSAPAVARETPGAPVEELGRLGYYFDRLERRVCRSFVPYRLTARERLRARCDAVLDHVEDVSFAYLGETGATGGWVERWREPTRPVAVRFTVVGSAEHGRGDAHTLVVALPQLGPKPPPPS